MTGSKNTSAENQICSDIEKKHFRKSFVAEYKTFRCVWETELNVRKHYDTEGQYM